MKLKKFKEKDNKRIGITVFTLVCIFLVSGVILYRTFAIFEVRTNQNVIKGTVQDPGNIYFAFYYDGGIQRDMPEKGSEYVLDEEQSYCGVNGSHDDINVSLTEDYRVIVSGMTTSRTKCNLYFVKGKFIQGKGIPIVEDGDGLYEVSHEDYTGEEAGWKNTELRFAGKDPKNYVWFNDELWRMIGLVNVRTSDAKIEQRLKIIKNESIGDYSWDSNNSNDWTNASLMEMLNNGYYNSLSNVVCYNQKGDSNLEQENGNMCDFSQDSISVKGIDESARLQIDNNITWNLGGILYNEFQYLNANQWYENERGNKMYESIPRPTIWPKDKDTSTQARVGLSYPSDYGYATNDDCLETTLFRYNEICYQSDWLFLKDESGKGKMQWTLSSSASSNVAVIPFKENVNDFYNAYAHFSVLPVVYLKQNVKIVNDGQDGSINQPYHLQQIL